MKAQRVLKGNPAVEFSEDWSGMRPWVGYNWRDFTVIHFAWEWDNVMGGFEIEAALIGFHCRIAWTWYGEKRAELEDTMRAVHAGEVECVPIDTLRADRGSR